MEPAGQFWDDYALIPAEFPTPTWPEGLPRPPEGPDVPAPVGPAPDPEDDPPTGLSHLADDTGQAS